MMVDCQSNMYITAEEGMAKAEALLLLHMVPARVKDRGSEGGGKTGEREKVGQ
jgi:hypothetical protein